MRKIKSKYNFKKRAYRHMTVSEVKEEFGGDVKKYIDWEIEVLKVGMEITENREVLEIVDKYKNELIENIKNLEKIEVDDELKEKLNKLIK